MKHHILLRVISSIAIPFIFMFGWYVLFHGKVSPGGGRHGGAISATAFILHAMIFSVDKTKQIISLRKLRVIGCIGAFIFCSFGFLSLIMGGKFLEYNIYSDNTHLAQFIGIMGVEVGVQLTVFAVLTLIFMVLAEQESSATTK